MAFNNTGTLDVPRGTLQWRSGGTNSGTFNIPAGAEIQLPNRAYTFATGAVVTGPGILRVNGGTLNFVGPAGPPPAPLHVNNVTVVSGNLGVDGSATIDNVTVLPSI